MKFPDTLDRYLTREWVKILGATALGFPLFVILIDVAENIDEYLDRGIAPGAIALSYVFSLPDQMFRVLPAAVLFATVFAIGAFSRHSELTAAQASGRSFYRTFAPLALAATVVTGLALVVGEAAPPGTRRQLELLGEREASPEARRFNFVYRAEEGWVYLISSLDASRRIARDLQLEREGTGADYPTIVIQARRAVYDDSTAAWTVNAGRARVIGDASAERTFAFDSLRLRSFTESPTDLLAQPKRPQEMRYAELGRYIDALERSGGDGARLRTEQILKIAIPFTCLIIAWFSAPLAVTSPRASGALGIGIGLGTTIVFLLSLQLSQAVAIAGVLPPTWAAWLPNGLFALAGTVLMARVRT